MIIGLTGGIGSGKTTVASFFSEFNKVAIYIADREAKKLINNSNSIKQKITKEFGEEAYVENTLNRNFISKIVFNNKEKLTVLNNIVHPEVRRHFKKFKELNRNKQYIVYEAAILFESKSNLLCDFVITVTAKKETRINRILKRDQTSKKEVLNRMNNQWEDEKRLLLSNYVIHNEELNSTKKQVFRIHNILTKK